MHQNAEQPKALQAASDFSVLSATRPVIGVINSVVTEARNALGVEPVMRIECMNPAAALGGMFGDAGSGEIRAVAADSTTVTVLMLSLSESPTRISTSADLMLAVVNRDKLPEVEKELEAQQAHYKTVFPMSTFIKASSETLLFRCVLPLRVGVGRIPAAEELGNMVTYEIYSHPENGALGVIPFQSIIDSVRARVTEPMDLRSHIERHEAQQKAADELIKRYESGELEY